MINVNNVIEIKLKEGSLLCLLKRANRKLAKLLLL